MNRTFRSMIYLGIAVSLVIVCRAVASETTDAEIEKALDCPKWAHPQKRDVRGPVNFLNRVVSNKAQSLLCSAVESGSPLDYLEENEERGGYAFDRARASIGVTLTIADEIASGIEEYELGGDDDWIRPESNTMVVIPKVIAEDPCIKGLWAHLLPGYYWTEKAQFTTGVRVDKLMTVSECEIVTKLSLVSGRSTHWGSEPSE